MYYNNVGIHIYAIIAIIGLVVGKIVAWSNVRLPENKKIFSKDFFEENKKGLENNYIIMLITAVLYIAVLYKFGLQDNFFKNLDLIKFLILIPMLECAFFIDLKHRIIPNRLTLTIFETGLIVMFVYGLNNINVFKNMLLGMCTGAGIFLGITLLGGILSGKEAMGLGDVKYMGAVGIFFGPTSVLEITLLSFILAAISLIIIIPLRKFVYKTKDEYIPFGPFLVISTIACIFLKTNIIFTYFIAFCKGISNRILGIK
ncbi:MAG: prepilin peptidase [Clostridia bacterium]|nr:prepilin peptidase [Clostridia bacterium]